MKKRQRKIDQKTATIIFIVVCIAFCAWCVISSAVEKVKTNIENEGVSTPDIVQDVADDFGTIGDVFGDFENEINGVDMDKMLQQTEPEESVNEPPTGE